MGDRTVNSKQVKGALRAPPETFHEGHLLHVDAVVGTGVALLEADTGTLFRRFALKSEPRLRNVWNAKGFLQSDDVVHFIDRTVDAEKCKGALRAAPETIHLEGHLVALAFAVARNTYSGHLRICAEAGPQGAPDICGNCQDAGYPFHFLPARALI